MVREIIIRQPNKKEGTTGLLVQTLDVFGSLKGIYIGRFWDKDIDEYVFVSSDEIKDLIEVLKKVLEDEK